MTAAGKRFEAARLIETGAQELDIGVRTGALLDGRDEEFAGDMRAVVEAVAPVPVKVILELPWPPPAQRDRAADPAGTSSGTGMVEEAVAAEARFGRHGIEGSEAL
jgi:deoxyribose-phosphate aldolase